jgi:hypothetical protein
VLPRVVRGAMQHGAGEVDASEFTRCGLTHEYGASCSCAQQHGVGEFRDSILEHQTCVGVGPSSDVVQFLHTDWNTTKWTSDIGILCSDEGSIAVKEAECIQVAAIDRVERGLQFFDW